MRWVHLRGSFQPRESTSESPHVAVRVAGKRDCKFGIGVKRGPAPGGLAVLVRRTNTVCRGKLTSQHTRDTTPGTQSTATAAARGGSHTAAPRSETHPAYHAQTRPARARGRRHGPRPGHAAPPHARPPRRATHRSHGSHPLISPPAPGCCSLAARGSGVSPSASYHPLPPPSPSGLKADASERRRGGGCGG